MVYLFSLRHDSKLGLERKTDEKEEILQKRHAMEPIRGM